MNSVRRGNCSEEERKSEKYENDMSKMKNDDRNNYSEKITSHQGVDLIKLSTNFSTLFKRPPPKYGVPTALPSRFYTSNEKLIGKDFFTTISSSHPPTLVFSFFHVLNKFN